MKIHTVEGNRLALVDRGAGQPVVLLHGFPQSHAIWNAQIDALSRDYRVIAPDMRGFGQSSGAGDGAITMRELAEDLAGLLDVLKIGEPIALCGLSMGGYVAFQFCQAYGDRLRGLMLCDTRARADDAAAAAGRLEMANRVLHEGPAPLIEQMMPKLFAPATVEEQPQVVESLRRIMADTDPKAIAAAARGMAERPDATSSLGRIECPTLVIVGERDAISTPDEMRAIAQAIPNARLVEIAGAGHMTPMERPAEVNAAMQRFLRELT